MPSFNLQVDVSIPYFFSTGSIPKKIDVTVAYSRVDEKDFTELDSVRHKLMSNKENTHRIIGFDIWTCNSGSTQNPIAGIALCDGKTCLICQLWTFKAIPTSLSNFLRFANFIFVSSGTRFAMEKLEANYGLGTRNVVELGPLTGTIMSMPPKPKSLLLQRWDVCRLNEEQIAYVTTNACSYCESLCYKFYHDSPSLVADHFKITHDFRSIDECLILH